VRLAMKTQVDRRRSGCAFFALVASLSLPCTAACSSGNAAPAGGCLEHPSQRAPTPVASAEGARDGGPPALDAPFSPLDKAIVDDCLLPQPRFTLTGPPRAWSQNVPDRDCTNDGDCGDGFCDRGHCAAIWTCAERYGQRCINGQAMHVPHIYHDWCEGICLEGRCRSCVSDAECVKELGDSNAICYRRQEKSRSRICIVPQTPIDGSRNLPPPPW
jgi:hypothetical protein